MKKKMHFTIMGLVVAVLALALALTGCAKDASGNTNASTSESVDVNTDMQDQESHIDESSFNGTVWEATQLINADGSIITMESAISTGLETPGAKYVLEFTDERTCYVLKLESNKVVMAAKCAYDTSGSDINISNENISSSKLEDDHIVVMMRHGLGFIFEKSTIGFIEPIVSGVDTSTTSPSDGYLYTVNGHEIVLHTRLENYINDGVISFGELIRDLGYSSSGYIYNEDDDPVAQIGRFVYIDDTVPCHVIETFINIPYIYEDSGYDEEHIYIFDEHGNSGVLTINGYGSRPIHISYNQLIAATYIWETYSDGRIHENPLRDVFGDDGMIREHNYFVS